MNKRQKRERRKKNRERMAKILEPGEARIRTSFRARARSGDEVVLDMGFDQTSVPFDPDSPSESLASNIEIVRQWERSGCPTRGEA